MNHQAIIDTLKIMTDTNSEHYRMIVARVQNMPNGLCQSVFQQLLAEPLEQTLAEQDEFKDGLGYLVWQGDGGTGFHAQEAAATLVRRVVSGESTEDAIQWLERALTVKEADALALMALWGIDVPEPLTLSDDIDLISFNKLPSSSTKDWILQSAGKWIENPLVPMFFTTVPPAVLIKKIHLAPVITRTDRKLDTNKPLLTDQLDSIGSNLYRSMCSSPGCYVVSIP